MLQRHSIDLAGIREAPHVIFETEDRRTFGSSVASNAFEDARAIVNDVTDHMDRRVFPVDEAAVPPDPVMIVSPRHAPLLFDDEKS
jgi:hypothetical protein